MNSDQLGIWYDRGTIEDPVSHLSGTDIHLDSSVLLLVNTDNSNRGRHPVNTKGETT